MKKEYTDGYFNVSKKYGFLVLRAKSRAARNHCVLPFAPSKFAQSDIGME